MRTTTPERIAAITATGAWGSDTLHGLLEQHAAARPTHLAVKDQPNREQVTGEAPRQLSWAELESASENLALQLQGYGVGEDDKVIVQLPNVAELAVVYYALSKLGAIVSPVPVQYASHELQMMAAVLDARVVVTLQRFGDSRLGQAAREALPDLSVLCFGQELGIDVNPGLGRCQRAPEDANRVLSICWTSGTTGTPKGVPRSHNMWLATGRCSLAAGNYTPADILLNPFPMVNMAALGGFLFPSAILGCSLVLHHPLDAPLFLKQMQDERVSFTIVPPALLNQLAKSKEMWNQFDFTALRGVGSGSAPLAPWMIEVFSREFGKEVVNFYGSNEGISLYSTPQTAPDPEVRASMFKKPSAGEAIAARVADPEDGREVSAPGERGELLVAGATVFDGYYKHDNVDVFCPEGYFRTGDLVEICGEGGDYYKIVGRCKDIINRGGMKISPVELDVALEEHPQVVEAAVCAYPDERLGEKICACLVMKPGQPLLTLSAVQEFLLGQGFAKFKLPERVVAFEQLPRNALGKVQRFVLQDGVAASLKLEG
jgi:acyl-CoA synthetase (AMP-forming)/AMP-acid ligase II